MSCRTLILTALAMEAQAIAREFGVSLPRRAEAVDLSDQIQLRVIGLRAVRLNAEVCRGFDKIMLAGLAGGLDPALKIGDVVIDAPADFARSQDARKNNPAFFPSPGTPGEGRVGASCTPPNGPHHFGTIHASDQLISTAQGKLELFRQTGALAVDMESDVVRKVAAEAGIPLIIVRAISDTADQALRPEVLWWLDADGRPRPGAVAVGLARDPLLIPHLIRLGRQSRLAGRNLGIAVHRLAMENAK